MCICMYCICIEMYVYVLVCNYTYRYVLVCIAPACRKILLSTKIRIALYWFVLVCIHMYTYLLGMYLHVLVCIEYIRLLLQAYMAWKTDAEMRISLMKGGHCPGARRGVVLLFRCHVRTDQDELMECTCAMIETLWDYCPGEDRPWWRSTAHIGTKMLYLPKPDSHVWVVPISSILGRLPLVPLGDNGTIPRSMAPRKHACFPQGICDKLNEPGSGSECFYINTWGMVWPSDHPKLDC